MFTAVYTHVCDGCLYAGGDDEPESSVAKKAKTEDEEEEAGINSHYYCMLLLCSPFIIQVTVALCTNSSFLSGSHGCVSIAKKHAGHKIVLSFT